MPDVPALSMPFLLLNLPVLWIVLNFLSLEAKAGAGRKTAPLPRDCPHCLACSGACRTVSRR